MAQKFSNKARSQLLAAITPTDTSFSVVLGEADLFPTADVGTGTLPYAPGNWFKAVLENGDDYEIVYVRSRAAGSNVFSNVLRGQEGTVAKNFPVDSVVSLRVTAQDVEMAAQVAEAYSSLDEYVYALDQLILGDENVSYTLNGVTKPSISRAIHIRLAEYRTVSTEAPSGVPRDGEEWIVVD